MNGLVLLGLGLPPDASADGWRIDRLFTTVAWMTGALALAVLVWLAIILVRDREGRAPVPAAHPRPLLAIALTTLVVAVVDGTLLVGSCRDLALVTAASDTLAREPGAVRVEVNAHQWSWDFRQSGPDGAFGTADDVVALDRLVVPLGRPVLLELASTDVVHGLYLPAHRVKVDVVPGQITRTWFRPARLGRFEIGCSQFCGVGHDQMRAYLEVVAPDAHRAYLADEAADAERVAAEDERALAEEPSRVPEPGWPRWSPVDPATAWAWAWPWDAGRR